MIDDGLSNGIVGDLSADILGGQSEYLKISNESITHETPDLDRVLESLSERRDGQTRLIPNTEYRTIVQDPQKVAVDVQRQKQEVVRTARWMNMQNEPSEKVERYLEKFADEGLLSHAEASTILAERPLHGQLYLDRNTASKCVDVRHASRKSAARQALWVIMAPGCELCKTAHGFCPESGKKLIPDIPATMLDLREACRHLMGCGRILSDANITDWDDLKQAMSPPEPSEMWGRVYPHAVPVVTSALPKMDAHNALRKATTQEEKNNTVIEAINAREVLRIARAIGELLLKGTDPRIVKNTIEHRYPAKDLIKSAVALLHKEANPDQLLTHITAYPYLYEGDCHMCKDFLIEHGIRVAAVKKIEQCADCQNRKNATRSCSLIGARVMESGVLSGDIDEAIDELHSEGKLTAGQVRELKTISDPSKRLTEAVKLSYETSSTTISEKSAQKLESKNSSILPTESAVDMENRVLWAVGAFAEAATATQVKTELRKKHTDAEEIVNNALVEEKTVQADPLAAFMDDKYFSQDNSSWNNGETPDVVAIREFFADSDLVVNVDAEKTRKTIDIGFLNEGAKMTIDLGQNDSSDGITNYEQLYEALPKNLDIGPNKTGEAPLEVQGLGAAEGLDLSGIF